MFTIYENDSLNQLIPTCFYVTIFISIIYSSIPSIKFLYIKIYYNIFLIPRLRNYTIITICTTNYSKVCKYNKNSHNIYLYKYTFISCKHEIIYAINIRMYIKLNIVIFIIGMLFIILLFISDNQIHAKIIFHIYYYEEHQIKNYIKYFHYIRDINIQLVITDQLS